jgi:hypothetical protein
MLRLVLRYVVLLAPSPLSRIVWLLDGRCISWCHGNDVRATETKNDKTASWDHDIRTLYFPFLCNRRLSVKPITSALAFDCRRLLVGTGDCRGTSRRRVRHSATSAGANLIIRLAPRLRLAPRTMPLSTSFLTCFAVTCKRAATSVIVSKASVGRVGWGGRLLLSLIARWVGRGGIYGSAAHLSQNFSRAACISVCGTPKYWLRMVGAMFMMPFGDSIDVPAIFSRRVKLIEDGYVEFVPLVRATSATS